MQLAKYKLITAISVSVNRTAVSTAIVFHLHGVKPNNKVDQLSNEHVQFT